MSRWSGKGEEGVGGDSTDKGGKGVVVLGVSS